MPAIDAVSYGEIEIGGKTYYSDVVLWWDGKKAFLPKNHILDADFLASLLKRKPEAVVIGIGLEGSVEILPGVKGTAKKHNVRLFVDKTENAVDIFNGLIARDKKAVAVLHVTL